jgi:hypothetical protein
MNVLQPCSTPAQNRVMALNTAVAPRKFHRGAKILNKVRNFVADETSLPCCAYQMQMLNERGKSWIFCCWC